MLADKQEWNYRSAFHSSFLSVLTLSHAEFTSVDCVGKPARSSCDDAEFIVSAFEM